jgi:acyl-CoA reductase-like NAD-dependent aldehyde dehydrogenase
MPEVESRLSDREVDLIAARLAARLGATVRSPAGPTVEASPTAALGEGIFATVDDAVEAAGLAFRNLEGSTLEKRGAIVASIRESMVESAEDLARHAHRETGLGRAEDKLVKNLLVARKTSGPEVLTPQAAIERAGGPTNLVCAVANPTIESAQELMRHRGVRLLAVTGGAGVVREAMTSGKRAICAGPGNPPVVVDSTADLELAGRQIVAGGSFDNNIVCTDEKEVIAVDGVVDDLLRQMEKAGAYLLDAAELRRLERVIFTENRGPGRSSIVNKDLLGKNASVILAAAGIEVRGDPRLAVARVANDHPLVWTEQMMPVMPVTSVPDVEQAIELAKKAEHGYGHSAGMYSRDIEALSQMARVINTSIFTKNGPFFAGLGEGGEGHTSFTIASPTGEGLTGPISFSRLRRCVLVDHFRIV